MVRRLVAALALRMALIWAAGLTPLAGAEPVAGGVPADGPPAERPRPANPRVLLPLALNADSELEAAGRAIRARRWETALPMLQALADRDGDGLAWNGSAYVPLRRLVNRLVASLPDEARRTYALLYDAEARRLCDEGLSRRSPALLKEAASRYLNTTDGPRATSALAAILMDRGEFGPALRLLRETDAVALSDADARAIAAREIICLARLNQREEAERLVAALEARGLTHVTAGGAERECREFMQAAFAELSPAAPKTERNAWNSLGGNAAGDAAPPSFDPGSRLPLEMELPWPARTEPDWPSIPAIRPVAAGGSAFISRDGALIAIDMQAMRLKWFAPPPGDALALLADIARGEAPDAEPLPGFLGVGNVHNWRTFDNQGLATLCLADGRLFAVRWNPWNQGTFDDLWDATPEDVVLANELRCYDAEKGAVLWRTGASIGSPGAALADCWFYTAPTVHHGRAYVLAARSGRLHAMCLDAKTGKLLWDSGIGAFESRQQVERYCMSFFLADTSPPSVADGVAVYPTGQGIVCAYDAYDGEPLWISAYERSAQWIQRLGQRLNVPSSSWTPRQPIISEGRCLITPLDSRHLVALSLETGDLLWQAEFPAGVALLGQSEGRAFVQHSGVSCLDARTGAVLWETDLPAPPVGVGTLSQEAVLLPEHRGVRRLAARTGRDEGLVPHAPALEDGSNLLLLDDALLVASPERLTLCLRAEEALSRAEVDVRANPQDAGALLRRAAVLAEAGETQRATADVDRALALADQSGDPDARAYARRAAAGVLARLALRSQRSDLLDRAFGIAPQDPALQGELAVAALDLALRQPAQRNPTDVYLALCRDSGMLGVDGAFGEASLWTELARTVRQRCPADPELARTWQRRWQKLAGRAVESKDPAALAELVRWDPMPDERAELLLQLGALWASAGQADRARRALVEVIATEDRTEAAERAAAMLNSLGNAPGAPGAATDYGTEGALDAAALRRVPSPRVAWTARGALVLPSQAASPSLSGKVLVIEAARLKCLDVADGKQAWEADLPPEGGPSGGRREQEPRPPGYLEAGCPAYCAGGSLAVIMLPRMLLGVDLAGGKLLWQRESAYAGRTEAQQAITREELIGRARRALPVPPPESAVRQLTMATTACEPLLAACRLVADGEFIILDAVTGEPLLERRPSVYGGLQGARAVIAGAKLCVAVSSPRGADAAVYDLKSGELLARWRPRQTRFVSDLRPAADGCALLADYKGILKLDLRLMEPVAEWRIAGGVDRIVCADEEVAVVRTVDGGADVLDARTGAVRMAMSRAGEGEVLWAERRGDAIYALEAARLRRRLSCGPETHWQGSGFILRAVRMPDGKALWTRPLPAGQDEVVGPPIPCEGLWLIRSCGEGRLWIAGVDAESGMDVFSLELEAGPSPAPLPLLVSGGRVILGAADGVVALEPGDVPPGQAVQAARGDGQ